MKTFLHCVLSLCLAAGAFFAARHTGLPPEGTAPEPAAPHGEKSRNAPEGAAGQPVAAARQGTRLKVQPKVTGIQFLEAPAAHAAALRLMSKSAREGVVEAVLIDLHLRDPKQLEILLASLDGLVTRSTSFYVKDGQESAVTLLLQAMPQSSARDILLENAARQWCYKDWPAAMAWAETLPSPQREELVANMAMRTLQRGGDSDSVPLAIQWLHDKATPAQRQALGPRYVDHMAKSSPAAALDWARENMAGRPLASALARVLEQQAAADPAAARRLVEELPPGSARSSAACAVVAKHPDEASVRWLLTQASRESQRWYQVSREWARREPDAFKRFLATEKEEVVPVHLVDAGIGEISRADPRGTVEWAVATGREKYITSSLEEFSDHDPAAAAEWILENPAAPVSGVAVYIATDRSFRQNPEASARWAMQLPEGPRRDAAIESLQRNLGLATNLPPEERAKLQEILHLSPVPR